MNLNMAATSSAVNYINTPSAMNIVSASRTVERRCGQTLLDTLSRRVHIQKSHVGAYGLPHLQCTLLVSLSCWVIDFYKPCCREFGGQSERQGVEPGAMMMT